MIHVQQSALNGDHFTQPANDAYFRLINIDKYNIDNGRCGRGVTVGDMDGVGASVVAQILHALSTVKMANN